MGAAEIVVGRLRDLTTAHPEGERLLCFVAPSSKFLLAQQ